MLKLRNLLLLAVLAAAAIYGASRTLDPGPARPEVGELVFPELLDDINSVARVRVLRGGESFELVKGPSGWGVPRYHGYPVAGDKIHRLLVGAAGLTREEPKTANPELMAKLGLDDPAQPDTQSVHYTLFDAAGTTMAAFKVGTVRASKSHPARSEIFVHVDGEPGSWLAEGGLPTPGASGIDWLERDLGGLDPSRIKRVRVTHQDGEVIELEKSSPKDLDFLFEDVPPRQEVDEQWRLNDIGRVLTTLEFEQVVPAAEHGELGSDPVAIQVHTYDGMRFDLRTGDRPSPSAKAGGDEPATITYATIRASFDESVRDSQAVGIELEPVEKVKAEVAARNRRYEGWVFALPEYKVEYIKRRRADLLKTAEAGAAPEGSDRAAVGDASEDAPASGSTNPQSREAPGGVDVPPEAVDAPDIPAPPAEGAGSGG